MRRESDGIARRLRINEFGIRLAREAEGERQLNELPDFLSADLGRAEAHRGERVPHCRLEERVVGANKPYTRQLDAARLVYDEKNYYVPLYPRRAERAGIPRRGVARPQKDLAFYLISGERFGGPGVARGIRCRLRRSRRTRTSERAWRNRRQGQVHRRQRNVDSIDRWDRHGPRSWWLRVAARCARWSASRSWRRHRRGDPANNLRRAPVVYLRLRRRENRDADDRRVGDRARYPSPNRPVLCLPRFQQACKHGSSRVVEFKLSDRYPARNSVRVTVA